MPERVEKFKRMYVKVSGGGLIAAHLHREVAWHGIKVLDKKQVFLRQIEDAPSIFVPSIEDRLLINSAHVIFENYILGEFERCLLKGLLRNKIDWDYVNCELKRHSFKKVFYSLMKALKSNPNKPEIIKANMVKILKCPSCIWHIGVKIIRRSLRVFSLRRHGCLIALVGVNGSGKTTLANQILSDYEKITDFFHGQYGYYFGWEPFLPTTKMLSKRLKKQNKSYYKELSEEVQFSVFKEAVLLYSFIEYYFRYLFHVCPKLRNGKLVVTDRYFYDLYGQNNYSEKSLIVPLLLKLFPKPDYTFILDADYDVLTKRDKNVKVMSKVSTRDKVRRVHKIEDLQRQRQRYAKLKGNKINTERSVKTNVQIIIDTTWRSLIR